MQPQTQPSKRGFSVPSEDLVVHEIFDESAFRKLLQIEEKRTERSRRRFVLMLLECTKLLVDATRRESLHNVLGSLSRAIRETDIMGWYRQDAMVGIVFTEIGAADGHTVTKALLDKTSGVLSSVLNIEEIRQVQISFYVFPEESAERGADRTRDSSLYPDEHENGRRGSDRFLKRSLDICGSLAALIVLAPVFLIIGVIIKFTSKGPVFFRQQRVGHRGRHFTFLKFRSMYTANHSDLHEEFVKRLISGEGQAVTNGQAGKPKPIYKIVNDPRITSVGKFLRKTSLDELPQFINVLRGEMSLVGPRPAIPYEVKCYDIWHRRRHVPVKPGITGLWQVNGRSRVGFDEMIRLDLQYARSWSIWLDIKILMRTPLAVILGEGAY